jgi:Na+/pantothenate symporter
MIKLAKVHDVSVKSTNTKQKQNTSAFYIFISHGLGMFVYESIMIKAYINTTGATSGAGTAYPSGALEFTPGF